MSKVFCIALFLFSFVSGCENSFSPKAPFEAKPVIFCALDPTQSIQIVRLSTSYNPPGLLPEEYKDDKSIEIESVRVNDERRSYIFKDSLMILPNGDRMKIYFSKDLIPTPNTKYSIHIKTKSSLELSATILLPQYPGLSLNGATSYLASDTATSLIAFAENAAKSLNQPYGSYIRLWALAEHRSTSGVIDTIREEVTMYQYSSNNQFVKVFPTLDRVLSVAFSFTQFLDVLRAIQKRGDQLIPKLICKSFCLEVNLYSYLKIVHGFDDPLTIRTEIPDFTNIKNGFGVFGGMTVDSIIVGYSKKIFENL